MTPEPLAGHTMSEDKERAAFEAHYKRDASDPASADLLEPFCAGFRASLAQQAGEDARDGARLDFLDKNPKRVKHAIGYVGAPDSWAYTDSRGAGHDAPDLRAAIDQAMKGGE